MSVMAPLGMEGMNSRIPTQGLDDLSIAYRADEERYRANSYSGPYEAYTRPQLIGHMMLTAHSLEKGLSSDVFELGHGFGKLIELIGMVRMYEKRQYDKKNYAYINALSILESHLELYRGTEYEETIRDMFAEINQSLRGLTPNHKDIAGVKKVTRRAKQTNNKKNYAELVEGRSSVRAFSEEPINKSDLKEAIQLAQRSPSACNRQATRVYEIHDPVIIKEVMFIQEGFTYENPPQCITLIVADDTNFSGAGERNQGYVDGGMFAMSFMYALEYMKLAACPLHASFTYEKEQLFRKLLNIPDSEKLIVFLAIGQFKEEYTVAKSYRYPVEYISREVTSIDRTALVEPNVRVEKPLGMTPSRPWRLIDGVRQRLRIRTRIRSVRSAHREGKLFFSIYKKMGLLARSKKKRIIIFGAPFHSNLGDQAQTYCMEAWYAKHFPEYSILSIDTVSAFKMDQYLIRKVRDIIRPSDRIVLHSGYHTTDLWDMENQLNLSVISTFPDFHITVFPQTVYFESFDNLKHTASIFNNHGDITLMCRDEQSYQTAQKYFNNVDLMLMPDIVTTLIGVSETERIFSTKARDGIMMCFRNDKESRHGKDVSTIKKQISSITQSISQADTTIEGDPYYIGTHRRRVLSDFLSKIACHKLVITDRYHGTIFSVITNTPVIVLGSTDHKLSSGVRWFSDKCFADLVYYAESPTEAVKIAKEIYGTYDYSKTISPIFNKKYWDKSNKIYSEEMN